MLETEFSDPEFLGEGSDAKVLTFWLDLYFRTAPERCFRYMDILHGLDRSIRAFGHKPFSESKEYPRPMEVGDLAGELISLAETEARYRHQYDPRAKKGWELFKAKDKNGNPIILACAVWILPATV